MANKWTSTLPKGEKFETINREDKSLLTPGGDIPYHVDFSTNITVLDKTAQGDMKDGTRPAVNK